MHVFLLDGQLRTEIIDADSRSRHDGPDDLHRAVVGRLRFLQKRPDRVRSFFQAPETRYAA